MVRAPIIPGGRGACHARARAAAGLHAGDGRRPRGLGPPGGGARPLASRPRDPLVARRRCGGRRPRLRPAARAGGRPRGAARARRRAGLARRDRCRADPREPGARPRRPARLCPSQPRAAGAGWHAREARRARRRPRAGHRSRGADAGMGAPGGARPDAFETRARPAVESHRARGSGRPPRCRLPRVVDLRAEPGRATGGRPPDPQHPRRPHPVASR